jgi:hypothetical protein
MNNELDEISLMLFEANEIGSQANGSNTNPCSICNSKSNELHFHGSDLNSCARKVYWNKVNGKPEEIMFVSIQYLMDGHLHESSILKNIKAGLPYNWKVKVFENNNQQIDDLGLFKLVCHYDAMLIDPNGNAFILECKAVKPKYFKEFKESRKIRPEWYGQIQSYMLVSKTNVGYFLIKNRENSDLLMPIKVIKDMKFIASRLSILGDIASRIKMNLNTPPEMEYKDKKCFSCTFCSYRKVCYGE